MGTGSAALLVSLLVGSVAPLGAQDADTLSARADTIPSWVESIVIQGTLDTELAWIGRASTPLTPTAGTDTYLRRIELGFSGNPVPWITAFTLFSSEYVGLGGTVRDTTLAIEEAHLDVSVDGRGPYAVLGLQTQPFGLFENRLMKDPLTRELYATDAAGLTFGVQGAQGLDVSVTAYRGGEQYDAFLSAPELDGGSLSRRAGRATGLTSFIAAATVAPDSLPVVVKASFLSEPGRGARNSTGNVALHVSHLGSDHVSASIEGFAATSRETLAGADGPFLDRGLSVDLTYEGIVRPRQALGSGNFAQRRSRIRDHPMDATVRYERFDDGGLSAGMGVLSVRDRAAVGGHFTVYEHPGAVYLMGELRWTRTRVPAVVAGEYPASHGELFLGFGVSF